MNGDLNGQDSWTLDASADGTGVIALGAFNGLFFDTGAQQGNTRVIAGLDPTQPWQLVCNCEYRITAADDGGTLGFFLGDSTGASVGVLLRFSAGDGALNQLTQIAAFDAATEVDAGPLPFAAGTAVTVTATYNGTSLVVRVNGTIRATVPVVTIGATPGKITLQGLINNVLSSFVVKDITISQ